MQVMESVEEEIVLTPNGRRSLEDELEQLITVERHDVAARIKDAKDYGDLTENAEYEAAKNAQAFVEGRILDIRAILSRARVLRDEEVRDDLVSLGSVVTVRDVDFGDDWTVTMVSPYEADPSRDLISNLAPIGRGLMGKSVGERVEVKTPGGTTHFEIISIHA
jgi:transcription elongation factor GreA